jgi:predicted nucleic acid-binding protein
MPTLFADAGYWIAIMYPGDQLHQRARTIAANLSSAHVVTTQMVLTETLNFISGLGESRRRFAAEAIQQLQNDPNVEIVEQTDAQFKAAAERYTQRSDQTWSLTDCSSFLVMEERSITEALAFDRDFEQAGFVALLREG